MTVRQKRILLGLCITWFLYALTFTPSGDDMERIRFAQTNFGRLLSLIPEQYLVLNGRVIGNFLSFALINPFWLRALIKAVCVTVIAHSLWKIAGLRSTGALVFTFLLITAMPLRIHVQVYNWSSGFFNYTVPMALLLFFLARNRNKEAPSDGEALLTGFAACLFVEHVTAFLLVLALLLFVLYKMGYVRRTWFWFAVGVLPGAVLMFASPGYSAVFAGNDWYRRVPVTFASISAQLFKNMGRLGPFVLAHQMLLPLLLFGAVFMALKNKRDRGLWALLLAGLILFFYPGFQGDAFSQGLEMAPWRTLFLYFLLHMGIWIFLIVRVAPLLKHPDRGWFFGAMIAWLLLYAPLLIVQPIGPRNYYAGTLALVLIVLLLLKHTGFFQISFLRDAGVFLLACLLMWRGSIHISNTRVYLRRDREIREAMAARAPHITVEPFPYIRYMHGNQTEGLENLYYYHTPGDLGIYVKE